MHRAPRRRPQQAVTLLLTVALAAVLGSSIYFAVTSLPYLAVSPTSDPTFGALNECLMRAVPQRVGFAVSRNAKKAAAWSGEVVAECVEDARGVSARTSRRPGVVEAAYDGAGHLWVADRTMEGFVLSILEGGATRILGSVAPQALVGTAEGVVALEPSGRLLSVHADGAVGGLAELPALARAQVTASADGRRVAVVAGGGFWVFDSATLTQLRKEAPCDIEALWWLRDVAADGGPARRVARVACGPDASWGLDIDVDSNAQEKAAPPQVRSVLAGPDGPWVQACDVLPCTAVEP